MIHRHLCVANQCNQVGLDIGYEKINIDISYRKDIPYFFCLKYKKQFFIAQISTPPGLPVYGCRDCGQDATCVMCAECFNVSEHKNHNYRISTTEGMTAHDNSLMYTQYVLQVIQAFYRLQGIKVL